MDHIWQLRSLHGSLISFQTASKLQRKVFTISWESSQNPSGVMDRVWVEKVEFVISVTVSTLRTEWGEHVCVFTYQQIFTKCLFCYFTKCLCTLGCARFLHTLSLLLTYPGRKHVAPLRKSTVAWLHRLGSLAVLSVYSPHLQKILLSAHLLLPTSDSSEICSKNQPSSTHYPISTIRSLFFFFYPRCL